MISPEKESVQKEMALRKIADAMTALRFEKELGAQIAKAEKDAAAARRLLNDARKLQKLCDQAGIERDAVLRRARSEGLL